MEVDGRGLTVIVLLLQVLDVSALLTTPTRNRNLTWFSDALTTWNHATDLCNSVGMHLVTADTVDLYTAINIIEADSFSDTNFDFWLGLHRYDIANLNDLLWADCDPLDTSSWTPWRNEGDIAKSRCIVAKNDLDKNGNWEGQECGKERGFALCEKATGECWFKDYPDWIIPNDPAVTVVSNWPGPVTLEFCKSECRQYWSGGECWGLKNDATGCTLYVSESMTDLLDLKTVQNGDILRLKICFTGDQITSSVVPNYIGDNTPWKGCDGPSIVTPIASTIPATSSTSETPVNSTTTPIASTLPATPSTPSTSETPVSSAAKPIASTLPASPSTPSTSETPVSSTATPIASTLPATPSTPSTSETPVSSTTTPIASTLPATPSTSKAQVLSTTSTTPLTTTPSAGTPSSTKSPTPTSPISGDTTSETEYKTVFQTSISFTAGEITKMVTTEPTTKLEGGLASSGNGPFSASPMDTEPTTVDNTGQISIDEPPIGLCVCECHLYLNLTEAEKIEFIGKIITNLTIDVSKVSATKRKYISAHDPRPSAKTVGSIGVVLLSAAFGALILLDIQALLKDLGNLCRSLSGKQN